VPATRKAIARAFAPRLRFNAFHNDGNASRQNRNEDHFPTGVASLFREVASGRVRVVTQPSVGAQAAVAELRATSDAPVFGQDALGPFPERLVGDAPGGAPIYVNVYEDPATRAIAADGSGSVSVWIEYYVFYPFDRAEASLIGLNVAPRLNLGGHRGDWEHTHYRVRVQLGPGGALLGGAFEDAVFYAHGHGHGVEPSGLETVDDQGRPDPAGRHAVVYVAQGKHASYPQAGEWPGGGLFPTWAVQQTDFFRGNGVVVDTWRGAFVDLEDPAGELADLASPDVLAAFARSPVALSDWSQYRGRWGTDHVVLGLPGLSLTLASPAGPKTKRAYGDFGRTRVGRWADVKRAHRELRVYRDLGIMIPDVVPPPLPIRR
jgi:hypothetical protein